MPFFLVCILVVSLFIFGCMKGGYSLTGNTKTVSSEEVSNTSRAEIEKMLKRVERKDAPEEYEVLCYAAGPPTNPEIVEYVCPLDGEKTVLRDQRGAPGYNAASKIIDMRRLVEDLNSKTTLAKFSLDERRLCHTCFPGMTIHQRFVTLVTKYPDGREVRYDYVVLEDLVILEAFLNKKLSYGGENRPLKSQIGKIRYMLGINSSFE